MTKLERIKNQFKHGLIVSCQALGDEPMYSENGGVMPLFAKAALLGGAVGIRANSKRDVEEIKKSIDLPVIGLIKNKYDGFPQHITVTMKEIDDLVQANTDIIALDCTNRIRPDGLTSIEFVNAIKLKYPNVLLMADISTFEEGLNISKANVDFVGTTLSGYTSNSTQSEEPDFNLVKQLVDNIDLPIIAEGRIKLPEEAKKMLDLGAYSVVVGGAITRPQSITQRFVDALNEGENV